MIKLISPIIFGYLIGSIPFGFITGRMRGIDLRKIGSGNIGATNTFRALGVTPAIAVFILDLLKGTIAVEVAKMIAPTSYWIIVISGVAAVIGHMYPIFLGFKGGKGSATSLGVLAGIAPDLFVVAMVFVLAAIYITRIVSVTSIIGVILLTILMFAFHKPMEYSIATSVVAALVIIRHIPNIKRLLAGTEPRIWGNK